MSMLSKNISLTGTCVILKCFECCMIVEPYFIGLCRQAGLAGVRRDTLDLLTQLFLKFVNVVTKAVVVESINEPVVKICYGLGRFIVGSVSKPLVSCDC